MIFIYLIKINNFPEPLSNEEIINYIQLMKEGKIKARDKIFNHNLRLVISIVKNYQSQRYELEDLFQIGCIGLMQAINSFDYKRNISFSTYATSCIKNQILIHFNQDKNIRNAISLNQPLYTNKDGNECILEDVLSDQKFEVLGDYLKKEEQKLLNDCLLKLRERDRKIIMLSFGFYNNRCYTQKEIAEIFNMTQQMVSQIITKSIIILKKAIEYSEQGIHFEPKYRKLKKK